MRMTLMRLKDSLIYRNFIDFKKAKGGVMAHDHGGEYVGHHIHILKTILTAHILSII